MANDMDQHDINLRIDLISKTPLALQIKDGLLALITTGTVQPGDPLPPVRQLAARLSVNFNTVARAYRELDLEGWVITRQGRGTFVIDRNQLLFTPPTRKQEKPNNDNIEATIAEIISTVEQSGIPLAELIERLQNFIQPTSRKIKQNKQLIIIKPIKRQNKRRIPIKDWDSHKSLRVHKRTNKHRKAVSKQRG